MLIQIPDEQRERIESLARERGFENPVDYLLALVDADDDFIDDPEEDAVDLKAEFRQAWRDAMTGNTRPAREALAEIRRKLKQDGE
jgi:hypothetical protein